MWLLGAYPIIKKGNLDDTLKKTIEILRSDQRIIMFPTGKIARYGRKKNPRRGAIYLAARTGFPIFPCSVRGFQSRLYPMGFRWSDFLFRRYRLSVAFGEPFFIQEIYGTLPETDEEYREASEKAMQKVYALQSGEPMHETKLVWGLQGKR